MEVGSLSFLLFKIIFCHVLDMRLPILSNFTACDARKNYPELFCLSRKLEKTGSVNKQKVIPNISLRNASVTGFLWSIRDNLTFGITKFVPNSGQIRQAMQTCTCLRFWRVENPPKRLLRDSPQAPKIVPFGDGCASCGRWKTISTDMPPFFEFWDKK